MGINRALLSVWDKEGLADFARNLSDLGVALFSSGGTASFLRESALTVGDVRDITGFPEILDGRVKTLHPAVHGGILARRDRNDDMATLERHHIDTIDLVAVNLYPFEMMLKKAEEDPYLGDKELEEFIDIGGPTLLRGAAKNYRDVIVLCDPADYRPVISALKKDGDLALDRRRELASKVFALTSDYDRNIFRWLSHGVGRNGSEG